MIKIYLNIVARIVTMFIIGVAFSYLTEHLRGFFGDTPSLIGKDYSGDPTYINGGGMDEAWQWGVRHYYYYWTLMILFWLSLIFNMIAVFNLVYDYQKQPEKPEKPKYTSA